MARQDYILRMIEQFGTIAIAIRKLIFGGRAGSSEVKNQLLNAARHAGMDLELARAASPDTLAILLSSGGEIEPGRCWMWAETLYLDGLDAELGGDPERARGSFTRARTLYSLVAPMGGHLVGFTDAADRIQEIDGKLAELEGQAGPRPGPGSGQPRRVGRQRRPRVGAPST